MKKLIINGDDFALSPGANRGIIKCFKEGILTSTTLMANGSAFEEAIKLSRENPGLGIGLHLVLNGGKPVLSPEEIPTLVNKKGYFPSPYRQLISGIFWRKIEIKEVEKELRAQFEKATESGLKITHIDSHRHLHAYPPLLKIMVKLARAYGISKMRYPGEKIFFKNFLNKQCSKMLLLKLMFRLSRKSLLENKILTNEHFFGIFKAGNLTLEVFENILKSLPEGISEIMCHPGYVDEGIRKDSFYLIESREKEIEVLTSPPLRKLIKDSGIELINYGGVQ
jgi:hopanoid biosynthesis associated protein HpnK